MSFKITPEQQLLRETLERFLSTEHSRDYLRKQIAQKASFNPDLWEKFLELGLFTIFVNLENCQSTGLKELCLIAEQSGRVLLSQPLLDSIYFCSVLGSFKKQNLEFLEALANLIIPGCKDVGRFLSQIEERGITCSIAFDQQNKIKISKTNLLSGQLDFVPFAETSQLLLVFSTSSNSQKKEEEFVIITELQGQGVKKQTFDALDLTQPIAQINFTKQPCLIIPAIQATNLKERYFVLKAAELYGVAKHVLEITLEYVKQRRQFSQPIAAFQVIQHRLADLHLQIEALGSLVDFAAWAGEFSLDQLALSSRAALSFACQIVPQTVEQAIQLHGGIGFTWEHDLHLYLRRAQSFSALFNQFVSEPEYLLKLANRTLVPNF